MYIECKGGGLTGPARIGRVSFSKTGATLYYGGKSFCRTTHGFKANYYDTDTGEYYWISGPKKNGQDALYATHTAPEIDADIAEEYRNVIRGVTTAK